MSEATWTTAITEVKPNQLRLRGYRLDELMGRVSFTEVIHLALLGELPPPDKAALLNAILVASIDHGVTPPSCLAARIIASTGAPLNAALAGGVLSINRFHGGAVQGAMELFQRAVAQGREAGDAPDQTAAVLVAEYRAAKKRLPGLGHRVHNQDPRSLKLIALARASGLAGEHLTMALALETAAVSALAKRLPLNVDGAIAALLCDLGIPAGLANAFFIMARVPGLVAHIIEEQSRMRPMRLVDSREHAYDGASPRELPPAQS
ncbi:MAG: citryl-CoA lyase [Deltaproteobacteria bacterium]|nr:citryl-CoA lyase [Deltaproteobacteria bacterium]